MGASERDEEMKMWKGNLKAMMHESMRKSRSDQNEIRNECSLATFKQEGRAGNKKVESRNAFATDARVPMLIYGNVVVEWTEYVVKHVAG